MMIFLTARTSAKRHRQTLLYIQAVDKLKTFVPGVTPEKRRMLYKEFLRIPSMQATQRLPGYCLLHMNMEVRLTTTLDNPHAVQDQIGIVVGIEWDPNDIVAKTYQHRATADSELLLKALPSAIYVKLHNSKVMFMPEPTCPAHTMAGNQRGTCSHCDRLWQKQLGVIAVTPKKLSFKYTLPKGFVGGLLDNSFVWVQRCQLPLAPSNACALYSMQGETADPGMVADWSTPQRSSKSLKWLIYYVLLSRVRKLEELVSINFSSAIRVIMEAGPPKDLIDSFDLLFEEKMRATTQEAAKACAALGWT